ncbi:MAG: DUF4105 domain-containing protein [Pseudomonadota bacterium]|nr:DUF4105 domain-containing protein [Pseudomonadota bacterium]
MLVLLIGLLLALPALASPRIGVVTMQPGEIFWERFGHDAIVVAAPDGQAISYNFGYFDPTESDFVSRFARGEMRYQLVALPLDVDLAQYRDQGRGVNVQWLDLSPAQAEKLAADLAENARPENAHYHYDYFRDNCATRVRDALDRALDGALGPQLAASSQGNTYRSEAARLASPAPWMWLAFQLGLGPNADHPLSRWDEAFIPMRLADSLRNAKTANGTPLVIAEQQWLPHTLTPEPGERAPPLLGFAIAGIAIALAWLLIGRRYPRLAAGFAFGFWLLCGLIGTAMLYLWLGTAHWAGWRNHALLLMNPLAWLLLPGAWAMLRGRLATRGFRIVLVIVSAIAALALVDVALGIDRQQYGIWIALVLPIHLALGWRYARPHASGIKP